MIVDPATLIIEFETNTGRVSFQVLRGSHKYKIEEGEDLKEHENELNFSLIEHSEIILEYFKNFPENADRKLQINISQAYYNTRKSEIKKFEQTVNSHNEKTGNCIELEIRISESPRKDNTSSISSSQLEETNTASADASENSMLRIAVAGKLASGKTELILGFSEKYNINCESSVDSNNTKIYTDAQNNIEWYEIQGIDIGKENFIRFKNTAKSLITENSINVVLYCLNSKVGKIENIERDFIVELRRAYPKLVVAFVITMSIEENGSREFANAVSIATKNTRAIIVLSKELRTNAGYLEPYGMEELHSLIYGGQR